MSLPMKSSYVSPLLPSLSSWSRVVFLTLIVVVSVLLPSYVMDTHGYFLILKSFGPKGFAI